MTTLITTWIAFNAGAATVVLWRYWCERRMDREAGAARAKVAADFRAWEREFHPSVRRHERRKEAS